MYHTTDVHARLTSSTAFTVRLIRKLTPRIIPKCSSTEKNHEVRIPGCSALYSYIQCVLYDFTADQRRQKGDFWLDGPEYPHSKFMQLKIPLEYFAASVKDLVRPRRFSHLFRWRLGVHFRETLVDDLYLSSVMAPARNQRLKMDIPQSGVLDRSSQCSLEQYAQFIFSFILAMPSPNGWMKLSIIPILERVGKGHVRSTLQVHFARKLDAMPA